MTSDDLETGSLDSVSEKRDDGRYLDQAGYSKC